MRHILFLNRSALQCLSHNCCALTAEFLEFHFNWFQTAIFNAYSALGVQPDDQGILDIAVSYDGAWQRHGFSSHNGVGLVIDLLTGLPLDFEVLSNF